jgi:hypothetical protein
MRRVQSTTEYLLMCDSALSHLDTFGTNSSPHLEHRFPQARPSNRTIGTLPAVVLN